MADNQSTPLDQRVKELEQRVQELQARIAAMDKAFQEIVKTASIMWGT